MKREVNPEIKVYIEETILPKYKELKGHTDSHIREVIVRSLKFSEQAGNVNIDMVYIIAASSSRRLRKAQQSSTTKSSARPS